MIRLAHLSIPAQFTPDDAVAVWRALLFFLLIMGATAVAHWLDIRRERQEKHPGGMRYTDSAAELDRLDGGAS